MTPAVAQLMTEHRLIEQVLGSLATFVERLEPGRPEARQRIAEYAEFFREFADRCHHGKEEDRLFATMREHGFPSDAGPLAVMLHEHDLGRAHVRALAEVGVGSGGLSATEVATVYNHAHGFIPLLAGHIQKEDGVLYPMAEQAVPAAVLERLAAEFEEFERNTMGEGAHQRLHELAENLIAGFPPQLASQCCSGCSPCGR